MSSSSSSNKRVIADSPTANNAIHTCEDARTLAKRRLPELIFEFIDGAAGDETGEKHNRACLKDIQLQPRVLRAAVQRDISLDFLGQKMTLPFAIPPMGMCNVAWPGTDLMFARLGAKYGVPVGISTASSTSMEDILDVSNGTAWFQLYASGDRKVDLHMVERARAAGCKTLVLTADVPQVARRPRELRHGFKMPFRIGPKQFIDFALHPQWSLSTLFAGAPKLANFEGPKSPGKFDRHKVRSGANWDFLKELRDVWKDTLVVKGVLSIDDAIEIKKTGVDAIQVSSHGGRQLASVVPPIKVLPAMRKALGPDYPLIYDSGIRSGDDIIKAYALGANLVMLGRPFLFAAAADGERGVNNLALILGQELTITLAQLGLASIADIDETVIAEI